MINRSQKDATFLQLTFSILYFSPKYEPCPVLIDTLKAPAGEVMLVSRADSPVNCSPFGMAAAIIEPSEDNPRLSIGRSKAIVLAGMQESGAAMKFTKFDYFRRHECFVCLLLMNRNITAVARGNPYIAVGGL